MCDATEENEHESGRTGDTVHGLTDYLRKIILAGELRPGERIRETAIAKSLNISRAPVREALRLIENGGLIEKTPNRSYVVAAFNRQDIFELTTLRIALEVLAARLALQHHQTIPALIAAIPAIEAAVKSHDLKALAAADRRFHEVLVECAEHKRLLLSYCTLRDQIELALLNVQQHAPNLVDIAERHRHLVDLAPDIDKFVEELTLHIREGMGLRDITVLA